MRRGESLLGALARKIRHEGEGCFFEDHLLACLMRVFQLRYPKMYKKVSCQQTMAINIGRRHGNISFEDDYVGNIRHMLGLRIPVVIHMQEIFRRRNMLISSSRTCTPSQSSAEKKYQISKVLVGIVLTSLTLRTAFKHFDGVESLRVSQEWQGFHKKYLVVISLESFLMRCFFRYNPAKMEYYNALVRDKSRGEVVEENPFGSSQFFWIDAGLCEGRRETKGALTTCQGVRFVQPPLNLQALNLRSHRFLIYSMDLRSEKLLALLCCDGVAYGSSEDGIDVHGFPQEAHVKYSGKAANMARC
eukprot:765092-Hanusia_phi.AAC.6